MSTQHAQHVEGPGAASVPTPLAIPRSPVQSFKNVSGLPHLRATKMAPGRVYCDVVVVKAASPLVPGPSGPLAEPAPIVVADEPHDPTNAERSSLKRAGDVLLYKPGCDVYVTGTATSPTGRPMQAWDAAVVVYRRGSALASCFARVCGPRSWRHHALRGWVLSDPEPTMHVPIRYELAFGGSYVDVSASREAGALRWRVHPANPSGRGFVDESTLDRAQPHAAPQWELPEHPVGALGRPVPMAGFGPLARPWSDRLRHAGTYDAAWMEAAQRDHAAGLPMDYPADFDPRFFHCGPEALQLPEPLRGDEQIGLAGLVDGQARLVAPLPGVEVYAGLYLGNGTWQEEPLRLDTVHVDLDTMKLSVCWRLCLDRRRGVRAIVIGRRNLA